MTLRRQLGLLDATMINVGTMIGSAVFMTAGEVARLVPSPALQLAAWACAALFSLAGALTIAELGAALPEAGGLYVYLREAFGPLSGFLYGWSLFTVIQTTAIAAIGVAFAQYLGHFVALPEKWVACAAVLFLTGINVLGVREGVWTQNVVTLAKIAVMAGLAVLALSAPGAPVAPVHGGTTVGHFGAALLGPLFAFDGWISISYMGGEVKRPGRNLPLAALASVILVAALYLAVNAGYLHVLGTGAVAESKRVASDTARALVGSRGAAWAAGLVAFAMFGALNGNILAGARVLYAMALEGRFFRGAGRVHPRLGTPAIALAIQAAASVAFVFAGGFDQLLTYCLFASWLFYAAGGVAVFVLRRRRDLDRPYRVWGYPIVPALFVAFAIALLVSTVRSSPREAGIGFLLLASGLPFYYLFTKIHKQKQTLAASSVDNL